MKTPAINETLMLYLPMVMAWGLWMLFRPRLKIAGPLTLALLWNFTALYFVNLLAVKLGWWSFHTTELTLAGMPLIPWLGWAILWGLCFPLIPTQNGLVLVLLALLLDLLLMPLLEPSVTLGSWWLIGELLAIVLAFIPGLLNYRWTLNKRNLWGRVFCQAVIFSFLLLLVLPTIVLELTEGRSLIFPDRHWVLAALQLQFLLGFAWLGLLAVVEFANQGDGTPVPFDPPTRLVVSGPYAYFVNPMQTATVGFLICYGWYLESWALAAAGPMVLFYALGVANPSENVDLTLRYQNSWKHYKNRFLPFLPRYRPIKPKTSATMYFAESCDTCNRMRHWFEARNPIGLEFRPAENFPGGLPERAIYVDGDYSYRGVRAIAKALGHIHLFAAILGWILLFPFVALVMQIVVDLEGVKPPDTPKNLKKA